MTKTSRSVTQTKAQYQVKTRSAVRLAAERWREHADSEYRVRDGIDLWKLESYSGTTYWTVRPSIDEMCL
jgi:hypothetical protein